MTLHTEEPTDLEQKIIHDGDCLEIHRCLRNQNDFEFERLWIYRELDLDLVAELVDEVRLFVKLTETPELKAALTDAEEPLKMLYQIVNYLGVNHSAMSVTRRYLYRVANAAGKCGIHIFSIGWGALPHKR